MTLNIEIIANDIDKISPFEKDKVFFYCYKKLKKLLKAISILTKDKQDKDIVKDILNCAVAVISNSVMFFMEGKETYRTSALEKTLVMVSLIETISSMDLLSENSAAILVSEYSGVANIVSKANSIIIANNSEKELRSEYFREVFDNDLEKKIERILEKKIEGQYSVKDKIKDTNLSYRQGFDNKMGNVTEKYFKPEKSVLKKDKNYAYSTVESRTSSEVKTKDVSERTKSIVKIIKENKLVTIKDISNIVRDISEKTIQRELANLVISGLLKREGERRWSRYSLA